MGLQPMPMSLNMPAPSLYQPSSTVTAQTTSTAYTPAPMAEPEANGQYRVMDNPSPGGSSPGGNLSLPYHYY